MSNNGKSGVAHVKAWNDGEYTNVIVVAYIYTRNEQSTVKLVQESKLIYQTCFIYSGTHSTEI